MKYKHIDSMLHNFEHSFVSLMNYVDGEYVIDVLPQVARAAPDYEIDINFADGKVFPPGEYPLILHKSIGYWREWLPKHMAHHRIEAARLSDVHLRYRLVRNGHEVIVFATDDRGKNHKVFVHA
jgi:hypothetical protein